MKILYGGAKTHGVEVGITDNGELYIGDSMFYACCPDTPENRKGMIERAKEEHENLVRSGLCRPVDSKKGAGRKGNPVMSEEERMYRFWMNMVLGKCYVKGECDSEVEYPVMASKNGSHFGPDDCFFATVASLPNGTHYVDCE